MGTIQSDEFDIAVSSCIYPNGQNPKKKRENFAKSLVLRCNQTRDDMRRSISPHFLPNFYILPKFALNFDFSKFFKKFFFYEICNFTKFSFFYTLFLLYKSNVYRKFPL